MPTWAQFLTGKCREMEKSTATGICFSSDAIDGRVIITIAGSTSTVKRGMEEIIRCIEGHAQYTEGDICLRRIRGESVDTDGFKKIEDSKPFDVGRCSEPFDWDRYSFGQCRIGSIQNGPYRKYGSFCKSYVRLCGTEGSTSATVPDYRKAHFQLLI